MSDESPPENTAESRQSERESQLCAMFDGELSAAECELLARRLARDEGLRAKWSRYSMIGAALRAERGVKLNDNIARRVQAVLAQDPTYGDATAEVAANSTRSNVPARAPAAAHPSRWMRAVRPVMGASIAAGVAAVSILWLRAQGPEAELVASAPVSQSIVLEPEAPATPMTVAAVQPEPTPFSNGEPGQMYSTPAPNSQTSIAPPARFANYVVAHSEYSGPLARRMALLGILGAEAGADEAEPGTAAKPADGTAPESR